MKYIKSNKYGFTMIELLIVLSIAGIILTAVTSFFLSNLHVFNYADDQVEVQHEAKMAMNQIVDKTMALNGIDKAIDSSGNNMSTSSGMTEIKKIILKNDLDADDNKKRLVIEFDPNSGQVLMGYGNTSTEPNGTIPFAKYITSLKVESWPTGSNFDDHSTGIKVILNAKKNNASITIENMVYFRNGDPKEAN